MHIHHTIRDLRTALRPDRPTKTIGFVPTMGALHAGHISLVERARAECDIVVVSIFVNPTQFNNPDDLEKYPRTMDADLAMLKSAGVDHVFAPEAHEMYPHEMETTVDVPALSSGLIGKIRPGHFQGMASVVIKLLNIAGADRAYFGEKDYQQLAIIKRMVADLNHPTMIIGVPIMRDDDGLAMSSRNTRLSPQDRAAAPIIYKSIMVAQAAVADGITDPIALKQIVTDIIATEPRATIMTVDIVDEGTLATITDIIRPAALLMNVEFGGIILIDQAILMPANLVP